MTNAKAMAVLLLVSLPRAAVAQPSGLETLTPAIRTRVTCSIQAAIRFAVPANLLLAVAEQEGGRVGQWVKNTNGSYDVGPLQFNTAYLRELEQRYGITAQDVEAAGCYPYELAAWRLHRHIHRDSGDLWTRAANYHSRTPERNARYRARLRVRAAKWARWLTEHVPTVDLAQVDGSTAPEPTPAPPSRGADTVLVSTIVERRATRRSRPRSRAAPVAAEHAARTAITTAAPTASARLVEELAALDAHRRAQLLELVNGSSRSR